MMTHLSSATDSANRGSQLKETMKAFRVLLLAFGLLRVPLVCSGYQDYLTNEITGLRIQGNDTRKAVVLIHGWNPGNSPDKYEESDSLFYLKNILHLKLLASDWKLIAYHWEQEAATGGVWDDVQHLQFVTDNATHAAEHALLAGAHLCALLTNSAPDLRLVHLIAHSAGSWAAYEAAQELLQQNPYVVVQVTILDPYIPGAVTSHSQNVGMMSNARYFQGNDRLQRLENYFARDTLFNDDGVTFGFNPVYLDSPTLGTHSTFNWRSGVDINQQVDWGIFTATWHMWYDHHGGPTEFYADSVKASIPGQTVEPGLYGLLCPFDYSQIGWFRSLYEMVATLPRFNTHPQGASVSPSSPVTLTVTAIRTDQFAWFKDGQLLNGITGPSYSFSASTATAGKYVVRASNENGLMFSDSATVSLTTPTAPAITSVSPSTLPPSSSTQLINIYGSNFKAAGDPNASTLIFRDPANNLYVRTPIFVSASQLQYYITVQSAVGTWSVTVTNAGQAASNRRTFLVEAPPANTGSLTVNLSPPGAVSAGAQWRVDGGSYRNTSDTATGLTSGSHTVSFKSVSGYTTPTDKSVTIASGANTTDSGTYTITTPSTYTLTLNQGGVLGSIVNQPFGGGGGNTYNAGAVVQLTATAGFGYHFVSWGGDASGIANPTSITMNGNKTVSANFASGDPRLGTLVVTIQPTEAAAAGVTWGWNENDYHASGTSVTSDPGNFFMVLHLVNGWSGAGLFPVTITAGQTTNYVIAVSSTTGSTIGADPRFYSTLAGLAEDAGSTDGTNNAARFRNPWGAAVGDGGSVYVADYGNHTIRKITGSGVVSTIAGLAGNAGSANGTGSAARFSQPIGVAVDVGSNVYVSDYSNHTIRAITPAGVVSTLAGLAGSAGSANGTGGAARFRNPNGVAVDSGGNVLVADYGNHTIRKITPGGAVSTLAGLAGSSGTANGVGATARFFYPSGLAVDNGGNVFVADGLNHTIRKITPDGTVSTVAGFPGSGGAADGIQSAARFYYPNGVAVDGTGNVFVADGNRTLRKINQSGEVSTLAGLSGSSGSADGNGSTVRFRGTTGVALDSAGNVFVVDYGNHTIRTTRSVGKSEQIITFGLLPDKLVNVGPFGVTATASSGLPVALSIASGPATVNSNIVTLTGAGAVTVRASQSGNTNFNAAPDVERGFLVSKLSQFITFGALSRQVVGDAPFALSAISSSGLPVSFSVLSGPAVVNGNIVTMTGAGLVVLRAAQSGDGTYAPAPNVDQVLIVAPGNKVMTDFQRLANGIYTFRFYGEPGTNYLVQASTNLVNWVPLATNQVSGLGYMEFTDISNTNFPSRFYRVRQ